ncbi:DNA polymerase III subunit alpha [Alphaproteobacteria bacterium]|nr:DNA polymerase III subunit alpha [Alphaproteobacteria bacterium]
MSISQFIHLNLRTSFSLLEGALPIKKLVNLAIKNNMPALAITDSNNLFGALEFSETCIKNGIQPIIGISINLLSGKSDLQKVQKFSKIILIAQNNEGYNNLLKLSSLSYIDNTDLDRPYITLNQLTENSNSLILLTGGMDGILYNLVEKGYDLEALNFLNYLNKFFKNKIYLEVQRHGEDIEKIIEPRVFDIALKGNFPIVATNEAYFENPSMYESHDALMCVAQGTYVDDMERKRITKSHYFKSSNEMINLFSDIPEAISNSLLIAKRCSFLVPKSNPILPKFIKKNNQDEKNELQIESEKGLIKRFDNFDINSNDELKNDGKYVLYKKRLDFELKVIKEMGFSGYFLIVADFIKWAKKNEIPVGPGRGSGAGSLVAWALTITDLDPIRFGLLFERFLNPDRISMPDFDIDFCQDRRDEVIEYVQKRYGEDKVAQIITFGTLQARAALRDVGRVLQLPYTLVDRICKMVPNNPANPIKLKDAIKSEPRFKEMSQGDEGIQKLLDISLNLEGLYRHASTHAAGLVISDRPLDSIVPLYRDPRSEMPVTQFSMKYAEMSGLVKFDFLGLKTLTMIEKAISILKSREIIIDINSIPLNDKKTFEMLKTADSVGVFQFESAGMRDLLREAKPTRIEDLIALVALYRPGPMENIPKYIACKNGDEKPEFLHETIEPVVSDTYGVIIYQEQVMQIAQVFAGYTLGQADILRRAMGKKIKEEMSAQRKIFVDGAISNNVDRSRAEYVFDLVDKFAGYGFNKAHSAGYALIAYQTAWLKANYPVEFYAASMTLEINNTDKLNIFRKDMASHQIKLLSPDINHSNSDFKVEKLNPKEFAVRYALSAIKNVGSQAIISICNEREKNGYFNSLLDFANRINASELNKRQIESLAKSGSFDLIDTNRSKIYRASEYLLKIATKASEDRNSSQENLFGNIEEEQLELPSSLPWGEMEALKEEFEAIGFYLSGHPLDAYSSILEKLDIKRFDSTIIDLNYINDKVRLAGSIESIQERTSSRGNKFAFLSLSDTSGSFEAVVFSEQLSEYRELLFVGNKIIITVDIKFEDNLPKLSTISISSLDDASALDKNRLEIILSMNDGEQGAIIENLSSILNDAKSGDSNIFVKIILNNKYREIDIKLKKTFLLSAELISSLNSLDGDIKVKTS